VTAWTWRLVIVALVCGLAVINATGVYAQLVAAHMGERGAAQSAIETQATALAARIEFLSIPEEGRIGTAYEVGSELTPGERQVLELIAQGHDNATIGLRLGISERTARNHVSLIFSKLGVNTRAQAIVRARDAGFGRKGADVAAGGSGG
jgi:DNA-binding NarL/FixJ family response regulator